MNDTPNVAAEPPKPVANEKPVEVRLDKSRYYSTVMGERTPADPHYMVHYWQNGLPFDASGILVPDDGQIGPKVVNGVTYHPLYTEEMRAKRDRLIERLTKAKAKGKPEPITADSPEEARLEASDEVNLESWIRGEVSYEPWEIYAACKNRFSVVYARLRDVVEHLVDDEHLVAENELAPHLKALLNGPADVVVPMPPSGGNHNDKQ